MAYTRRPAARHDLTPVHELTVGLAAEASVYGGKGYNSAPDEASIRAETGGRRVPRRRARMAPNEWPDEWLLRRWRQAIETLNRPWEAMGVQRLRARTNAGRELKVPASLLALACANAA